MPRLLKLNITALSHFTSLLYAVLVGKKPAKKKGGEMMMKKWGCMLLALALAAMGTVYGACAQTAGSVATDG